MLRGGKVWAAGRRGAEDGGKDEPAGVLIIKIMFVLMG